MLEVGQKVKLEALGTGTGATTGKTDKARVGTIAEMKENYIIIQFKNYKECITKADIIAPKDWNLYLRKDKQWILTTKEMLS